MRTAIRRPIRSSSRRRLRTATDLLPRGRRGFLRAGSGAGQRREARRQLRHDPRALGRREIAPAGDLVERAAAADAEVWARMHHTDLIARCLDTGFGARHTRSRRESRGTINSNLLGAKRYPPLAASALRARLVPSSKADDMSACGWIGGAASEIGASADITRSGGKVTITSVPMRSFDLSENVPPCRSIRFFAIGRPRPAPVSLTLMYWPPEAVQPTLSQISPPCGVNLMALDKRLRQIWRTARSSPHSFGRSGSNISWMVMPRLPARSFRR